MNEYFESFPAELILDTLSMKLGLKNFDALFADK